MRDFLTKDLAWKLFSLGLAAVIWFTVRNESVPLSGELGTTHMLTTRLPVLVMSAAADVREFKVSPSSVQVTVRGRPEVMNTLQEKEIHVTVDLTGIEVAQKLKKRAEVSMPPGITLVRVEPAEVDVVVPPKTGQ